MLQIGSLLEGKYKILNVLGRGGMSVVYLAMNERANKQWAIKEIRKEGGHDFQVIRQNLAVETEILKKLKHPNLPSIADVIECDDSILIIMDYVEGIGLDRALEEEGAQPQEDVIRWAKQLCNVLIYLHSQSPAVIYRDLKPSNIMCKPDGDVMLIDFGTAREFKMEHIADTMNLGTSGYAAPEQYRGANMGQTDVYTDIYNLGATLHHLITGISPCEHPFQFVPIRELNPALSGGFEYILDKCTRYHPQERYQSAAELMYDLEHFEEMDNVYRRKQKKRLGIFAASCLLTTVLSVGAVWGYVKAQEARENNYDSILANAACAEDYYRAILIDPARKEAYIGSENFNGLIQFLIEDDVLSLEESASLMKLKGGLDRENEKGSLLTVKVLDQLRSSDRRSFQDVCYAIGETYLFYYELNIRKDRYAAAAVWFQYACDRYADAKIYCEISGCLQRISRHVKSEEYGKLEGDYRELWEQIQSLQTEIMEYEDDLRIRVWKEIITMIADHTNSFCEVASQKALLEILNQISIDVSSIQSVFLQESLAQLQESLSLAGQKVCNYRDIQEENV